MTFPDPALIVLVGASGSGKTAWAQARYRGAEIVSSDALRGVVGSGVADLDASSDAFAILEQIVDARARRGLTVVIDTLGLDDARRARWLDVARRTGLPAVAVVFRTAPALCRERNRLRDRPVPARVLDAQLRRMSSIEDELAGWWVVVHETTNSADESAPADSTVSIPVRSAEFVLQVSRFPWGENPAQWLGEIARTARDAGFAGVALMDHLIQIPQVGRAWDPIPEPWVTLGFLAAEGRGLRLGTLVSPVTFHLPGVLAKAAATLDVLTGGRAFVGVGAGWWDREHAGFGLPFPSAKQRLDDLETAIETMRALWAPGTKKYEGVRVSLPETTSYPRPAGALPIIVGGGGERRTLEIAARLGDACNVPSELATLDRKIAVLHEHEARAGRTVAVTVLDVPVVGRDREHVATLVERLRGRTSAAAYARRHHAGTGTDHIDRYRTILGRGVQTVFIALPDLSGPDDVARLAPVLQAVAPLDPGTKE